MTQQQLALTLALGGGTCGQSLRSGGGWEAGKIVAAKRKEEKVCFSWGEGIAG